MQKCCSL